MFVIVRAPSPAFSAALSQHPERHRIDPVRAIRQHRGFVDALEAAGLRVVELPPELTLPDAPFVSDTILALPSAGDPHGPARLLVVTRPAEPSRRPEVASVADCARSLLPEGEVIPELRIEEPDTLEGGDVVVAGDRLLIGVSARTSEGGARSLAEAARALGYRTALCPVRDRLHLATAVTAIGPGLLIGTAAGFASIDAAGPDAAPAAEVGRLLVPDAELPAANVLALGGHCFMAAGYPRAADLLRGAGEDVVEIELDEFTRADGGPTCLVATVA